MESMGVLIASGLRKWQGRKAPIESRMTVRSEREGTREGEKCSQCGIMNRVE